MGFGKEVQNCLQTYGNNIALISLEEIVDYLFREYLNSELWSIVISPNDLNINYPGSYGCYCDFVCWRASYVRLEAAQIAACGGWILCSVLPYSRKIGPKVPYSRNFSETPPPPGRDGLSVKVGLCARNFGD